MQTPPPPHQPTLPVRFRVSFKHGTLLWSLIKSLQVRATMSASDGGRKKAYSTSS